MENLLGELGVKANISVGAFGSGAGEDPNTYKNKTTGESYSHADVVYRVKNYSNFVLG